MDPWIWIGNVIYAVYVAQIYYVLRISGIEWILEQGNFFHLFSRPDISFRARHFKQRFPRFIIIIIILYILRCISVLVIIITFMKE